MFEIKLKLNKEAIEVGKSYNINLDYSDESIKNVEFILNNIHNEYLKSKNTEGLRGLALIFGFYIIEVIEINHGKGRIERNHETFGENTFPFYWRESTLFPYAWCLKRIFDGESDNIEIKYKLLILK